LREAYERAGDGYKSIKHTMIAKQYFVEDHKGDKIAETLKSLQQRFKKYGYSQKDFAKLRIPRR
jgi:fructose-bisphosphate aldolase class 1